MAVYGRSREKWDPTKSKSKVSKNRTYELGSSLASGKLMFYLNVDTIGTSTIEGTIDMNGEEILDVYKESTLEVGIHPVSDAHFEPAAISFPKSGTNRVYIQSDGVSTHGFSLSDVAKTGRNYDVYLSYWVKLSQLNFGTSKGHSLGGFYRGIPQSAAQATAIGTLNPALILGISSSGAPEIRFHRDTVDGTFMRFSGPSGTEDHKIIANDWTQVTILIRGYTGAPTSSMVSMWIDGNPIQVTQSLVGTSSTNANWNGWFTSDTDPLGSLIGNHTKGYAADNTGAASEGFFGSFGQLLMFSQPVGTESVRNQMAKFIYEAQREGAYHLHSGIHSSSPRLEQLDLDRDSLYPPNFTLENYTMGAYQTPVERVSKKSESRYTEGYNTNDSGYAWKENASQYFLNKNTGILPHLRLHRTDSLLTNGNWYSDARSEFFAEDLVAAPNGFVVDDQASDELYREHYTEDTAQKFVEIDVPDDYKDCFVIDIPIPNTADLTLGTDRPTVNENPRINGTAVVSNPQAKIANMAYYNFASKQWETVLATDYDLSASSPKDTNFIDKNDIGFSPMSGLVVPNHEVHAQRLLPKYGLPTSDYGFPFDDKFNASSGQSIDLSKYIDQPVILEGWEIQTKVVPVVGYAGYTATNQNSTFYSSIGSGGKSPFHYGGHGESAVFFNHRRNMTGFDQNVIQDGSDYFHVGTTIPTTYESGGVESQPPIEQPGLVTSGVTAFLLKKSKITNTNALRDAYQATASDKTINKHSNCLSNAEGVAWSAANGSGTVGTKFHPMDEHMPDGSGVAAHPEWVDPSTNWSNYESTSLIGWLQQVYHNDEHLSSYTTRNNWVRNTDTGNQYRVTEGKQIVDMLGKEKATYVQNLLYMNTDEVDLNVRGNTKSVGKIVDGMPVTNFFITSHGGVGLGVYKSSSDDSGRYAVSTSSDTSINVGDGSLGDHSIVPRYGAGENTKSTIMPRLNMPTKVSVSSDTIDTFHKEIKLFESIEDDSTVILNPNDELVLGIQNSISTTFASQQIKGGSSNFVRWGRTSLKIPQQNPSQTASFIRLYVKKTRADKDFNVVADSSNYNSNVSRDLGDHANADRFVVSNPIIYSGSMADDVVGPTFFTGPFLGITVPVFAAGNSIDVSKTKEFTSNVEILNNGEKHGKSGSNQYWHSYYSNWSDAGFTDIPWNSLSISAFLERGQNAQPRFPAVNWTDSSSYDKKGDTTSYEYKGGYSINEWLELVQWVIIEPDPAAAAGPGAGGTWNETDAQNAGLDPITEPLRQPYTAALAYSQGLPFRDRPFCRLSEINTNAGNPTTGHVVHRHRTSSNYFQIDQSKSRENCPGISSWSMNITIPIFLDVGVQLTPYLTAFTCDFRLVSIPGNITGFSYGIHPTYHDGTQIALGDAFYFNRQQQAIKIKSATQLASAKLGGTLTDNDYWSRQWYHADARNNKGGPMIYIVGGEINIQNREIHTGHSYKSWQDINTIIADVLNGQQLIEESLLYTIETSTDGSFQVLFPQDPFLRRTLETFENDLHSASAFRLCGINMNQNTENINYPENLVSKTVRLHWDNSGDNDASVDHTMIWFGGDLGYSNSFSNSNTPAQNLPYQNVLLGTAPATLTTNYTQENNGAGSFLKNYLTPLKSIVKSARAVATSGISGSAGDLYPSRPNIDNITISFVGFPSDGSGPKFSIVKETYNEEVGRRIDRSVQRRFTKSAESVTSLDVIKEAGPFGNLRNILNLSGERVIYDSITPASLLNIDLGYCGIYTHGTKAACEAAGQTWNETDYITTLSDVPGNFPHEANEEKIFEIKPKGVKVKMYTTGTDSGATIQNTDTIVITNEVDGTIGNYSWEVNTLSGNSFDENGKGLLNISNYIQEDFKGNRDFTEKTIRDYALGFGNGPSGKMVIRPDVYPYQAWTSGMPVSFAVQWIIDPPRGARFGLYNVIESKPKYSFSYHHFGHLRDMLEQALDTKTTTSKGDETIFGAPVVISSINPVNPEASKLLEMTQRFNKTINATITKPYIESNYESKPQETNLNSEKLRVDVAGSIATKSVLAPGNVAANIRRR